MMKKKRPPAKINDQVLPAAYKVKCTLPHRSKKHGCVNPTQPKILNGRNVYLDATVKDEPAEMPRLFIRGAAGSMKMDLRGLGVEFSSSASAYRIPDDSLRTLGLECGDIAILDLVEPMLVIGKLVLLDIDCCTGLRVLSKTKGIWFISKVGDKQSPPQPLLDYPIQGVVIGSIRLYTEGKPVRYRGTEANFSAPPERRDRKGTSEDWSSPIVHKVRSKASGGNTRKHSTLILASENPSRFRTSEIEERPRYYGRAKMR